MIAASGAVHDRRFRLAIIAFGSIQKS